MVTVKSVVERISKDDKLFISLELTGDIELVQSQNSGRFYATVRRCFISSTFDEQTAKQFIGKQLPGNIIRTESDPYDYTVPETGEVISLTHSWTYQPDELKQPVETKHHDRPGSSKSKEMEFYEMIDKE